MTQLRTDTEIGFRFNTWDLPRELLDNILQDTYALSKLILLIMDDLDNIATRDELYAYLYLKYEIIVSPELMTKAINNLITYEKIYKSDDDVLHSVENRQQRISESQENEQGKSCVSEEYENDVDIKDKINRFAEENRDKMIPYSFYSKQCHEYI
jgi:hypothetical protein